MKYYHIKCDTCYCGEGCECIMKTDADILNVEDYAYDCARDNAESYGSIDRAREEAEESGIEFEETECYNYEVKEISEQEANDSGFDIQTL